MTAANRRAATPPPSTTTPHRPPCGFLLRADQALQFRDAKIHDSLQFALTSLLQAQYPNGGWPQGYDHFPDRQQFPVRRASFPDDWPRTWPGSQEYWYRYTLNDNLLQDLIGTLFEVARVGADPAADDAFRTLAARCQAATEKAGDYLILAQLPEPQPAWAQQYDFQMHPAWAGSSSPRRSRVANPREY